MYDMTSAPKYGDNQETIIALERKVNKLEIAEEGLSGSFGPTKERNKPEKPNTRFDRSAML
jgi:hypothetical protein